MDSSQLPKSLYLHYICTISCSEIYEEDQEVDLGNAGPLTFLCIYFTYTHT